MKCEKCKGTGDMGFTFRVRCNECGGTGVANNIEARTIFVSGFRNTGKFSVMIYDDVVYDFTLGQEVVFVQKGYNGVSWADMAMRTPRTCISIEIHNGTREYCVSSFLVYVDSQGLSTKVTFA